MAKKNQNHSDCHEEESMSDIAKHYTKEERESNGCKDCGVKLSVSRNSVCIYNLLERFNELVGGDLCRRSRM
jgi:hypothetical protein